MNMTELVVNSDLLICSICLEHYIHPRTLPCLHSFCHACLLGYVKKCETGTTGFNVVCPLCKKLININPEVNAEKWVCQLPVNFTLVSILDSKRERMSKENIYCGPCFRENAQVSSSTYCYDCSESICEECEKLHKKMKTLSTHKLCRLTSDELDIAKIEFVKSLTQCPEHSTEEVRYLCKDHDQACCNECAIVKHRKCDTLVSIGSEITQVDVTGLKINDRLDALDKYADDVLEFEKKHKQTVELAQTKIADDLEEFKQNILAVYDRSKQKVLESADKNTVQILKKIELNTAQIGIQKCEIRQIKDKIKTVQDLGQGVHMFLLSRSLKENIKSLAQDLSHVEVDDETIVSLDKGSAKITKTISGAFDVSIKSAGMHFPQFPAEEGECRLKPELVCEQKLFDRARSCTWLRNMAVVAFQDACRLCLFRDTGKGFDLAHTKSCNSQPWGLVPVGETAMVVCFPHSRKLELIQLVEETLETKSAFRTTVDIWDVAFKKNTEEIITLSRSGTVDIYKINGTVDRSVPLDENMRTAVKGAYGICYDGEGDSLYVSVHSQHSVVAIKLNGEFIFKCTLKTTQHPWHLSVSAVGEVYVTTYAGNAMHVLNRTGQLIRDIEIIGIGFCVDFSNKRREYLFICENGKGCFLQKYRY